MLFPLKVLNFKEISRHPINYYDGILTDLRFEKSNFDSAASIKIRTSAMHTKLSKECKKLHYLVACLIFWKKRSQGLEILYGRMHILNFQIHFFRLQSTTVMWVQQHYCPRPISHHFRKMSARMRRNHWNFTHLPT